MFIVISQDYESDKLYNFNSNNENYQTRRYSFGFVTSIDTIYTFNTYKQYELVPFEKLINSTDFFDTKSDLNFGDENFKVNISGEINKPFIEFSSSDNKSYSTEIECY